MKWWNIPYGTLDVRHFGFPEALSTVPCPSCERHTVSLLPGGLFCCSCGYHTKLKRRAKLPRARCCRLWLRLRRAVRPWTKQRLSRKG